jgi:ATP-dependent helicase HrpA
MKLRADRWRQNPAKDAERAAQLAPYLKAALALANGGPAPSTPISPQPRGEGTAPPTAAESFRWLVEEFRVSLFAQELGTAESVSPAKLDRALASCRAGAPDPAAANAAPSPTAPKPILTATVPDKKTAPVKSLNALDKLFGGQVARPPRNPAH